MPVNCGRRVTASDGAAGPIKWGFWRLHRPQAEGPAYFPEIPYQWHYRRGGIRQRAKEDRPYGLNGIADLLPGYRILGLRGWDDFIVEDDDGETFTLPTVPCDRSELARFSPPGRDQLIPDDRFTGKVKWYVTPIKFGGEPAARENITWISLSQDAEAVRWWNATYRDLRHMSGKTKPPRFES